MNILRQVGGHVFMILLVAAVPALLLYPVAVWAMNHTQLNDYAVTQGYGIGIALLFLPTAFLLDWIYRRFWLGEKPELRD